MQHCSGVTRTGSADAALLPQILDCKRVCIAAEAPPQLQSCTLCFKAAILTGFIRVEISKSLIPLVWHGNDWMARYGNSLHDMRDFLTR
jgi:hypothetical protein